MDSIPIFQMPSPQLPKGSGDTGQSSTAGGAFLALIEGFLGPSEPGLPPAGEPAADTGSAKGADGMGGLVQPGLLLETAGNPVTAELAGGLALQWQQPMAGSMPTGDAEGAEGLPGTEDAGDMDGTEGAGDMDGAEGAGDMDGVEGAGRQDAGSGASADAGMEPSFPMASTGAPPRADAAGTAGPAPAARNGAHGLAPDAGATVPSMTTPQAAAGTASPAAADAHRTTAEDGSGAEPAEAAPSADGGADAKAATLAQGGDGAGTGGGRGGGGSGAGDTDRSGNVLREENGIEAARSGAGPEAPEASARPSQDAAGGPALRTASAPAPGERPAVVEPPAAPVAPAPGSDAAAAVAPGAIRAAGEPAAGTSSAGFAPSAGHGPANPPHPASQMVSVTLSRMADGRADRMTIQLRPAELGTVEVKLDFRSDGTVQAMIVADRAETLGLLQRDAPTLEKALQDAGLKTDSQGLSFSLRDGGESERNFAGFHQAFAKSRNRGGAAADDGTQTLTLAAGPGAKSAPGRVDIRI